MSGSAQQLPTVAPTPRRGGRELREGAGHVADVLFRDPIRTGRLRLGHLRPTLRHPVMVGLFVLAGLLASLLLVDQWRGAPSVYVVESSTGPVFMPLPLLAVSLVAFALAWILIAWGALLASRLIRVPVALLWLAMNSSLAGPALLPFGEGAAFAVGRPLTIASYFLVPAVLLVSCVSRRYLWGFTPLVVLGIIGTFGAQVWMQSAALTQEVSSSLPLNIHNVALTISNLLVPLIYVSGIAVIQFSYDVAAALAVPAWKAGATVARVVLAATIAVKLWAQLGAHLAEWATVAQQRPDLVAGSAVAVVALAGGAWAGRRVRADAASGERAAEVTVYGAALVFALPLVISQFMYAVVGFNTSWNLPLDSFELLRVIPFDAIVEWGLILAGAVLLGVGLWLLYGRRRSAARVDVGLAGVLTGAWILVLNILQMVDAPFEVEPAIMDILFTAGVAIYLLVRWTRISGVAAIRLAAVVLFAWLVSTEADLLDVLGGVVGLAPIAVVVFGVVWTLLSDSSFAGRDGVHLPRLSRPLLWVGYILLTVTIINWQFVTVGVDPTDAPATQGLFALGLPLTVWILVRTPLAPPDDDDAEPPVQMRA